MRPAQGSGRVGISLHSWGPAGLGRARLWAESQTSGVCVCVCVCKRGSYRASQRGRDPHCITYMSRRRRGFRVGAALEHAICTGTLRTDHCVHRKDRTEILCTNRTSGRRGMFGRDGEGRTVRERPRQRQTEREMEKGDGRRETPGQRGNEEREEGREDPQPGDDVCVCP